MGREEGGHVIVEEGQSRGAEPLGVGRQVEAASLDAGLHPGDTVAAVAVAPEHRIEVGHEVDVDAGVGGDLLPQSEKAGILPELPFLQQLQSPSAAVQYVCAGGGALHIVDDEVELAERP